MRDRGQQINPGHEKVRSTMRIVGPLLALVGLACIVVAMVDFFGAFNSFDRGPRLFWLAFLGMPLLFVGVSLCMFAFMGAVTRFAAQEQAPVAADTFNYMADETREGVRAVAGAVREGFSGDGCRCEACGAVNDSGAKFCDACGVPLAKVCAGCGIENDAGARYCDGCGVALV